MRKILATLLFVVSAFSHAEIVSIPIPGAPGLSVTVGTGANALPLQNIKTNPNAVNITTYDDSYNNVPLGFDFPMYGKTFNNSWAMTNGLVTFQDPSRSGLGGACCSGVDLSRNPGSQYNYTIYGIHTDLYSWNGQNQYYLRGTNEMTYGWYNVSQCCSSQGGNSFEIKINSAGVIDTRIAGALVQWNAVTSGFAGDLSKGEYFQHYHGQGWNIPNGSGVSWGAFNGTGGADICLTNPLSSPSCPGYQTAYTTQQCTISALWDPSCPGYQQAYFTQQCSLNALYNSQCPGYQTAYLQQQCSLNPLYSTSCSGYQQAYHDQQCSVNTLYANDCPGYATAYLNQQCSLNPLYSTTCSGYQQAYHDQQCSINTLYATDCPGYAAAYKTQQCSISSLYATDCPGYAAAYKTQQCNLNQLYATDCPGYTQAYFSQQCNLNGLYDTKCPNYSTAYATQQALQQSTTTTTTTTVAKTESVVATTPTTSSDGAVVVPVVKDSNVNTVINTTATSASPAQAATATVPLVSAPAAATETKVLAAVAVENKQEEKKTEERKSNDSSSSSNSTSTTSSAGNASSDDKSSNQPKTARQELQERRESAAKAKAVESAKNLANEMGKASNMESQAAVQNVVIAAMGYSPAFEAYKVRMPDVPGYKPYSIYKNQTNVDNRSARRMFGGTDKLHDEMINSQYK